MSDRRETSPSSVSVPEPCPVPSNYSSDFGIKYSLKAKHVDKSVVDFNFQGMTEKHESQKGQPVAARPQRLGPPRVGCPLRPQNRTWGDRPTLHSRSLFTRTCASTPVSSMGLGGLSSFGWQLSPSPVKGPSLPSYFLLLWTMGSRRYAVFEVKSLVLLCHRHK